VGTCNTKKSKSLFGGNPLTLTSMISTGPVGVIVTVAVAFGTHAAAPPETCMLNVTASWVAALARLRAAAFFAWAAYITALGDAIPLSIAVTVAKHTATNRKLFCFI